MGVVGWCTRIIISFFFFLLLGLDSSLPVRRSGLGIQCLVPSVSSIEHMMCIRLGYETLHRQVSFLRIFSFLFLFLLPGASYSMILMIL